MGFRFRKSFKIAPGIRFNINKKSSSISFGNKKLRYTINSKGRRTSTVNLPGTGISYSKTTSAKANSISTYSESSTFLKNKFMFTDKLNYYNRPCNWLKFLLNIWWPLSCIAYLFAVGEAVSDWSGTNPLLFIINIVMTLAFFTCGLLARFLDKTAMQAIFVLEGFIIARSIILLIFIMVEVGGFMNPISEETGNGIVDSATTMVNGITNAAAGLMMAFAVMVVIIQVLIAVITIMYIQKRKDLFLSSEKEIKELYQ